ncbi:V-type ATPase [Daldinia decipiens]|uniref:V-type ATPase n=1 Tax=Daldinia decipiens TaxID=326647 RepID=UPI0020C38C83|nr:V-type ATPase [Daldinia decipiens]KAI1661617.1 V-type ATPase [Daldinia decipiens]
MGDDPHLGTISFFGAMGCAAAIIFTVLGASYGTAKSAEAIFTSGVTRPDRLMQNTFCAIMAQILSIYGLVASGFLPLGAGISVGLSGLAARFAIGIVGDAGANSQQPRLYVGMVLIIIFAEVLGLYGVIVGILMLTKSKENITQCLY